MTTFSEFLTSFDPDAGKRGKQFEHFVKWFLKNDPEWATQVDQVWLWDEYPESWGRDCGIDLVFKHKNGENWAVQAKCYASTTSITKADIDSFISESNREGIDKRLLIATTDLIGANAKQVCDAQDKKVTRYLLSHFDESDIEYPASLEDLPKVKPKAKPKPREHQLEAIEAVSSSFKNTDRGQMIMACGTGKTFTTLWIKEKLGVNSTLVLLPSLGLLSQTLHEWTMASNEPFEVLCVCSDESVGKKGSDESVHTIADLAFPVTSNFEEIKAFLNRSSKKVIFSTYQSSPLIAEAQEDQAVPFFDLAIADEAHRCAGKVSGDFSTILDSQKIRAKKRLFTTATPRTYSATVKKTAEGRGVEVVGMDDESVFGKTLFALNFGEAIKRGLLTDYRVVIIGVDDPTISAWIENRELLKTDSDIEIDAESLASQVGLIKAIKDYDLHRMISFHSRVSRAEEFSKDIHKVIDWIDEKHKPSGELKSDFVSGEMPTDKRRKKLAQLKGLQDNQRGLLTNARCLSEGVDVPSLDGVAFIDPRSSQIDIIQAVGRAIRLSTNKQAGTIVLPVFIGSSDDPEQALEEGNFKPIWDVLNALKAHDDVLSDELTALRVDLGNHSGRKTSIHFNKIELDIPLTVTQEFSNSIRTKLVENTTDSWFIWLDKTTKYIQQFGKTPIITVEYEGFRIGTWVSTQRNAYRSKKLSTDRIKRLEEIPCWSWDTRDDVWWARFEALKKFTQLNGHSNVPIRFSDGDIKLGNWTSSQRIAYRDHKLDPNRIKLLEALPRWRWDILDDRWDEHFNALFEYSLSQPITNIKKRAIYNGLNLYAWVLNQRYSYKTNQLLEDRIKKLESIDGFSWNVNDSKWNESFLALKKLLGNLEKGGMPTPLDLENLGIADWVQAQRASFKRGKLTKERVHKLESLSGWVWAVKPDLWDIGYQNLLAYIDNFGSPKVPSKFIANNGYQLGAWTTKQRVKYRNRSLTDERIKKLELISGWAWD